MTLNQFLDKYMNNNIKISEIEDVELRFIKEKYFYKIHEVVKDENNIKDKSLFKIINEIENKEREELKSYYYEHFH